jgi:glucose-6-phosphate isomerase
MLRIDWSNATEAAVGWEHGVTEADLREVGPRVCAARDRIADRPNQWEGWRNLPGHPTFAAASKKLAASCRKWATDMVVLGIGGSALGNIALQAALNPATWNLMAPAKRKGPRLFVLDNVDPVNVGEVLDFLRPRLKTTLLNVISKSGETAETASQFMVIREMLRTKLGSRFARNIVATTDAAKGTLHAIARADGYEMLVVPDDVGGRFSVLTPVGLFSAAMCSIDIDELLAGAAAMKTRVEDKAAAWRDNPACILAAVKYLAMARKHKPIHVMMPYSNRLYLLADWYRQIWAESLGKRFTRDGREAFVGPTPVKALGTTDQHSQVQLYREGPNDKLTVFLEVQKHPREMQIPNVFTDVPGMAYLGGQKMSRLLNAEKLATEYAMRVSRRPSVTVKFDEITPCAVGEFIYLYEFTTGLVGELMGIDAYDQPAVELGKQATFALMGKDGSVKKDIAREVLGRENVTYAEMKAEIEK